MTDSLPKEWQYFFKAMKLRKLSNLRTLKRLHRKGVSTIVEIFNFEKNNFLEMGFSDRLSENLSEELKLLKENPLELSELIHSLSFGKITLEVAERITQAVPLEEGCECEQTMDTVQNEALVPLTSLKGKRFVFYGAFRSMHNSELFKKALEAGAIIQKRPTSTTDYLVFSQSRIESKQMGLAERRIQILSENEFLEKIGIN